ncbi:MAG TPA: hypothetical protein V6D00_06535 [Pantanalinema sp.]
MRTPFLLRATLAALAACALGAGSARAYPNAVVFAPSGDVKGQGQAAFLMAAGLYGGNPVTWEGFNVGLLPSMAYGESGLSFGGLEVGCDASSFVGQTPAIKVNFNAKLQLLCETGLVPSLAVGTMQHALFTPERSLKMTYASLSKTLNWGETGLGRLTLGGAQNAPAAADLFVPTAPFDASSKGCLMAGYESPAFGPCYLAVDHVGGISEVGGTYAALNLQTGPGTYAGVVYALSNDRSVVGGDSVWFYISAGWDTLKAFSGR